MKKTDLARIGQIVEEHGWPTDPQQLTPQQADEVEILARAMASELREEIKPYMGRRRWRFRSDRYPPELTRKMKELGSLAEYLASTEPDAS